MMLIPEAWAGNPLMDAKRKAFYEYHAALMEPWDGPAAVAFTDGRQIGATLDRNGLRPARFLITDEDHVIMASEMGVLQIPEERILRKWRLQPGKMLLIDMEEGRIIEDEEIKSKLADAEPYAEWLANTQFKLEDLGEVAPSRGPAAQRSFQPARSATGLWLYPGGSVLLPGAHGPYAAMIPLAPWAPTFRSPSCRRRSKLLYDYFKQNFAQVTNPPIDPIREELVMQFGLHDRAEAEPAWPSGWRPQAPGSRPAHPDQRGPRQDPLHSRTGGWRLPDGDPGRHLAGGSWPWRP